MPYVTEQYYHEVFHGEPVEHAEFQALCERAGKIVEEITTVSYTHLRKGVYELRTAV